MQNPTVFAMNRFYNLLEQTAKGANHAQHMHHQASTTLTNQYLKYKRGKVEQILVIDKRQNLVPTWKDCNVWSLER